MISDVPLRLSSTNAFNSDIHEIVDNIDHSTFGAKIHIEENNCVKSIIHKPYVLKRGKSASISKDTFYMSDFSVFEGYLSTPKFMPLSVDLQGDFEKGIDELKNVLLEDEEVIIIWLFKKKYNWRKTVVDQYESYLNGNDHPVDSKFLRIIQEKANIGINKLANFHEKREYSDEVGEKIKDTCFDFQLKIFIKSDKVEELLEYVDSLLSNYDSHNRIVLTKVNESLSSYELSDRNQMLSRAEIFSLLGNGNNNRVEVADDTNNANNISEDLSDIITSLPYLEKEEIIIDESLVSKLESAMKNVGIISQARLFDTSIQSGSRLTVITCKLPSNVNFSKIRSKVEDMQVEMGVQSLSIEQGNEAGTIKFSVPNTGHQIISLREMIERKDFEEFKSDHPLAFVLGLDELNNPLYLSLVELVHLLIAGSTGSGKSVFVNTLLTTLLINHKPSELKMFLIDPKQVEFQQYNDFPHVQKVVTDMSEATETFEVVVKEMERRYQKFSELKGVKNIKDYNEQTSTKMPYIVVAVDEFADLVMVSPEVEDYIQRLGQKARAAGIHLIIATQRPSADILSKKIQTNIPNAISFYLGNASDYRTVFGKGNFGFQLLGQGDGVARIEGYDKEFQRFQSAIIHPSGKKEGEIFDKLISYYKAKNYDIGEEIVIAEEKSEPLIDQLKRLIAQTKETRIAPLREQLGVKGTTMTDLMNQLVEEGWLIKHKSKAKGYELVVDKNILEEWRT